MSFRATMPIAGGKGANLGDMVKLGSRPPGYHLGGAYRDRRMQLPGG
jgi:hypothetical protein